MYTRTVFIVVTYVCETYSNAIDIQNTVEKYWNITTESVCHIVICRICLDVMWVTVEWLHEQPFIIYVMAPHTYAMIGLRSEVKLNSNLCAPLINHRNVSICNESLTLGREEE